MEKSSWIRRMFEQGAALKQQFGDDKVFDLSLGNPVMEPPPEFNEALQRLASSPDRGTHRYMPNAGYQETRAAVAEGLTEETGLPFTANEIVMTVGAGGAINVVLRSILDPGDEVILLAPYFAEYTFYVDNHGGVSKVVPTDADFLPDIEAIEAAIGPKTRAVFINSPNNPTGALYPAERLQALGALLERKSRDLGREIFLISDEPYRKVIFDGLTYPHVFPFYPRTIVATSHSKDLALPGERIGYIAVNPAYEERQELIAGCIFANRILGFVNAPALMQRVVVHLQRATVDVMDYQRKRDMLYDSLTGMGYQVPYPQGAFYMFPRSPVEDELEFINELLQYNVLVVPGRGFGTPGYFRLSYCVEDWVLEGALEGFAKVARAGA
ncbi:MAG: aspartate aminotransferase [Chloroflexi bacterium]|jgi:aspartate aminotransferase|nr:MAG: aspartate aminotransferase [Chloroflexota bacterium]